MKKKLALLAALMLLAVPALAATVEQTTETAPADSSDLAVDEFVLSAAVSTELVSAVRCPIPTLSCSHNNQDCGIYSGVCHCKAGGGTLTCVKNPEDPGPIE